LRVAFIPARSGSKGIVGKNLVNLNGLPLISYSIVSALKSNAFDKIIVSTDSEEIANVAQKYGAHVPYMRPISLACDNSSTESVIIHFLEWSKNNGWKINDVTLLQPTSPIRRISSILSVLNKLDEYDSCFSVARNHNFFWKFGDPPKANYNYHKRPRRQDIKEGEIFYKETGSIYSFKSKEFMKVKNRICGSFTFFETPEDEQYEIDSYTDLQLVSSLLKEFCDDS